MWDGRRIVEVADVGDHWGVGAQRAPWPASRAGAGDQNPLASGYGAPAGSPDPNPDLVTRTVEVVLLLPAAVGPLLPLAVSPPQSTAAPAEPTQFRTLRTLLLSYVGAVESDIGSPSSTPLRIVVAKPGLDGHDRGAKVVARALRDAGMEVIYTGLHQTPEQIVATAIAEDADAIGLSVLSGAHMTLFAKVVELLKAANADDIVVFGGGIIPDADRQSLAEMGVAEVFTPGATMSEIVSWVRENVGAARRT
jgi:methylmalonyl-CoA mutase, C-terminal domain